MKTILNSKEVKLIKAGKLISALRDLKRRKDFTLKEAKDLCDKVNEAFRSGEPIESFDIQVQEIGRLEAENEKEIK